MRSREDEGALMSLCLGSCSFAGERAWWHERGIEWAKLCGGVI